MDGAPSADHAGFGRKIGPNKVIQLGHAETARLRPAAAADLYGMAGQRPLLDVPPQKV